MTHFLNGMNWMLKSMKTDNEKALVVLIVYKKNYKKNFRYHEKGASSYCILPKPHCNSKFNENI